MIRVPNPYTAALLDGDGFVAGAPRFLLASWLRAQRPELRSHPSLDLLSVTDETAAESAVRRTPEVEEKLAALVRLLGLSAAAVALDLHVEAFRVEVARWLPKFTQVVVPVRGALEPLRRCLLCLAAHTDPDTYSLVLVCSREEYPAVERLVGESFVPVRNRTWGGSPAGVSAASRHTVEVLPTAEPLEYPQACNLGATRRTPCEPAPRGARALRGGNLAGASEYLAFLDSDCYVPPCWLDDLTAPFTWGGGHLAAVGPFGLNLGGHQGKAHSPAIWLEEGMGPAALAGAAAHYQAHTPRAASDRAGPAVSSACYVIRRADWIACGGLSDGFLLPAVAVSDLSIRLRYRGRGMLARAACFVLHQGSASFRERLLAGGHTATSAAAKQLELRGIEERTLAARVGRLRRHVEELAEAGA